MIPPESIPFVHVNGRLEGGLQADIFAAPRAIPAGALYVERSPGPGGPVFGIAFACHCGELVELSSDAPPVHCACGCRYVVAALELSNEDGIRSEALTYRLEPEGGGPAIVVTVTRRF